MNIKHHIKHLTIIALIGLSCLSAISCKEAQKDYPMFWTWMEDREDLNLDSLFVHIKEAARYPSRRM